MKRFILHASLWIAVFSFALSAIAASANDDPISANPTDTLVVCPVEYRPALTRWIDYRSRQGRVVEVITPESDANAMSDRIREVARNSELKFLFLIGDVEIKRDVAARPVAVESPAAGLPVVHTTPPIGQSTSLVSNELSSPICTIPMHYVPAQVNVLFGSESEISSDYPYSDFNGDGLPDVAIGRLPANSADEVREYLDRIISYETDRSQDNSWRRRINFVAGVGGFGTAIDHVLEQFTKEALIGLIPAEYQTAMTMASWRSPFCPDPRNFGNRVVERFNEGCLFWIYIGHGQPTELDRLRLPDQRFSILNPTMANRIHCPEGNPIAIFLACYTGAIDHQEDCLTKVLLKQPHGPIAVLSGTRVTMPYGMSSLMVEVANDYFNHRIDTLGELVQSAKRKMVLNQRTPHAMQDEVAFGSEESATLSEYQRLRTMIQETGMALSPKPELLTAECEEHLQLMQLYGDPLLKLEKPGTLEIHTDSVVKVGTQLTVRGTALSAGQLCVELAYPRDRFRKRPAYRKNYEATEEAFRQYEIAYEAANNLTCDVCVELVEAGPFQVTLAVPEDISGDCIVRCILSSSEGYALGSTKVRVEK
jgi:hypothetical protein